MVEGMVHVQDLVLYKKFREKEVASAARGLITLFRELAPGMLEKRDRGRDADLAAAPSAFGARQPAFRVEGAELLQAALEKGDSENSEADESDADVELEQLEGDVGEVDSSEEGSEADIEDEDEPDSEVM